MLKKLAFRDIMIYESEAEDMEIYQLILIAVIAVAASCVQSITGFGFGIVAMIFLPRLLLYTEANVLSSILSALTSVLVIVVMWRKTSWKNLIFPLLSSILMSYFATAFVKSAKNDVLMLLLGIALLALSAYFFFFSEKIKIRPTWYAGLIAGAISGVMGGLFSISGPPVVIYYLQSEKDTDRYMATLSMYFVCSGAVTVFMKAMFGFVTVNVLICLAIGLLGMVIGTLFGAKVRNKSNPKMIKKAVYAVMAMSGAVNIVSSLMSMLS